MGSQDENFSWRSLQIIIESKNENKIITENKNKHKNTNKKELIISRPSNYQNITE